jgi:hypothetical protein
MKAAAVIGNPLITLIPVVLSAFHAGIGFLVGHNAASFIS